MCERLAGDGSSPSSGAFSLSRSRADHDEGTKKRERADIWESTVDPEQSERADWLESTVEFERAVQHEGTQDRERVVFRERTTP